MVVEVTDSGLPKPLEHVWVSMQDARNPLQAIEWCQHLKREGWKAEAESCRMRFVERVRKLMERITDYPEDMAKLVRIKEQAERLDIESAEALKALMALEKDLNPIKLPSREEMEVFLVGLRENDKSGRLF